ncbi:McrB family protein [Polaribacter sp. NJDZ03]|uniref:McrB family protein n=1 Tax=Polaribacter sp. NJDZ03 TaxID=2855841 RepID=UPI001C4A723D|nr:AAA family ATPase [Polaribacter sp. NJDZ03]
MIIYKDYEKQVYDWLMQKHEVDASFTFSLRQKATKGTELDYFIGTEKSNYFGITFWTLPISYPGSSSDCINLIFESKNDFYTYKFEFTQTNSPQNTQNQSVLNLVKAIESPIKEKIVLKREGSRDNKMFAYVTKQRSESYTDLTSMLLDIEKDLDSIIPIINNYIEKEKIVNPEFIAHRISSEEFQNMQSKLIKRFEKFGGVNDTVKSKILLENMIQTTDIFLKFQEYLFETRKNEITKQTINHYVEEASNKIPERWNDFYKNSFNTFKIDYLNLKKIIPLLDRGFTGVNSFIRFINQLINKNKTPTNQILYGPPGTGKTFYLKDQLFDTYTLKENAITKEKYFEEVVTNLTWWQVITLALIEIGTAKVNDILENRWVAKKAALSESKNVRATLWGTLQMHTIVESKNVAYKQRQNPLIFDKTNEKTWHLLTDEVKEQSPEIYDVLKDVNDFELSPEKEIKNYDFVTFHQSFAYEDFIEGIKPISPVEGEESKDLGYAIEDGVFKKLCLKAKNDPNNRYAIFIDEINRGNVSAIFGELITLIEIDKRKDAKNEISIKLPYSKTAFSVPSNIDIYGTMNTADRSVEALDTALRRRFEFKEMMPDYDVIQKEEIEGIKLSKVLEKINQRIELLIDRDHTIGHSYFVNVDTLEKLASAFNNKIIPLLQEYFYGDYGKIGLVLGKGFVKINKNDTINFADFKYDNANDFKIASYKLNQVDENTIIDAVSILLGSKETPQ